MVTAMIIKRYSELIKLPTFEERYEYLKLAGVVGSQTFGPDRWINQMFYSSDPEWRAIRDKIIIRDNGCDLGIPGREIQDSIIVHHMNPLVKDDILNRTEFLLNPDYLICTSPLTHRAIHYSNSDILIKDPVIRSANDTCPWKH